MLVPSKQGYASYRPPLSILGQHSYIYKRCPPKTCEWTPHEAKCPQTTWRYKHTGNPSGPRTLGLPSDIYSTHPSSQRPVWLPFLCSDGALKRRKTRKTVCCKGPLDHGRYHSGSVEGAETPLMPPLSNFWSCFSQLPPSHALREMRWRPRCSQLLQTIEGEAYLR
ncbi:hypothetical protein EVAR_23049_1 [Eumeta japonica]|uniref:Uncharacterized protein n=1 Tax=Eumeta variegata TaxID=151549 RepID=A0A4C1VPD0_EUMVA|nr:hypothetical protein EVAR_23049_1 [Eumeta japonica]